MKNINTKIVNYILYSGLLLMLYYVWTLTPLGDVIGNLFWALVPLYVGIIFAWLLMPLSEYLQKKGVSKALSGFLVVTGAFVFMIGLLLILIPVLIKQLSQLIEISPELAAGLQESLQVILSKINIDFDSIQLIAKEYLSAINMNDVTDFVYTIVGGLVHIFEVATSFIGILISIFMSYIIAVYIIGDLRAIIKRIVYLLSSKSYEKNRHAALSVSKTLFDYVKGLFFICSFIFIFYSIGLTTLGIPAAIVLALTAALFNVVPYLGPFLGGIPIFLMALSVDVKTAIFSVFLIMSVQIIEAYILQPKIMSKSVEIHSVTVVSGVLIFGALFGVWGVIIATPTLSIINVLLKEFDVGFHI